MSLNVDFLNVLIKKNNVNLSFLTKTEVMSEKLLNKIELHELIDNILSIQFLKYFNQVFKLLSDGFEEHEFLNKISYSTETFLNTTLVELELPTRGLIMSLYAHCFNFQSAADIDVILLERRIKNQ